MGQRLSVCSHGLRLELPFYPLWLIVLACGGHMEQRTYPGEISLISWSTRARSRLSSPVHRQCRLRGQLPSRRHSLGYCLSQASKYEWPPSSPVFSFLCYDHSANFKHMGRPTCGWCFSLLVVRLSGIRLALNLAWNTTEGQKHLFTLYWLDRLRQRPHFGRHSLRVNC